MEQTLPNELSARVKFTDIVKRFEKISNTTTLKTKYEFIQKIFKSITDLQTKFREENGADSDASFFPFLRLFLPHKDLERGSYGIQEKSLGKLFVQALALNAKTSTDAQKLTNLKGKDTNYGDIVYEVMLNRSPETGTLTVYEVNKYLDLIAEHFEENERRKIDTEMVRMLDKMSALDRKWITRLLLKKLRLGVGDEKILNIYNPNASMVYKQCSLLSRVCEVIDNKIPFDQIQSGLVQLFKPVRPMLCERGYISKINKMLTEHNYYLETKMDGERCLLHINGTEFKYFSRNCKDENTAIFGASSTTGLYSPFMYHQLKGAVKNAIFDGEMMVWDREEETFCKKTENFTAKHLKRSDERYNACFVIYDLIYYNEECLIQKPNAERVRLLHTIITEQKGALMLCERVKIRDPAHFLECLNKAFDANEEGVVIKQEGSKYHPGQRENGGWYKMKPDYENNLISDFDLLIIGGFYNDNRTKIDSFLMAVLKKSTDISNDDMFYSVCKIRNGLNRSQWDEILTKLEPFKHNIVKNGRNSGVVCPAGIEWSSEIPDFWYDPKRSIILQIKASDLVETNRYRTSHSFRFPRVMAVRYDKEWDGTCTLSEFQTFCSSRVEKLTKRHATTSDLVGEPSIPKRRRNETNTQASSTSVQSNMVEAVDNICNGLEFCIVNGAEKSHSVDELKNMVRRHGGKVVDYPNSKTFVVIIGKPKTLAAMKHIASKLYNIAKPEWLVRALGSNEPLNCLIKFTPDDMVFATEKLQEEFAVEDDIYDSYDTEPMDIDAEFNRDNQPREVNDEE